MHLLDYAEGRLDAFLREIEKLSQSEFPYGHSKEALDFLLTSYRHEQRQLRRLRRTTPETVKNRCRQSLGKLASDLRILGFLLRSTNVRNAFEIYGPLLEISRRLLGSQTKLILSSEWSYIPHTLPNRTIAGLPELVLIGVPAPESSNPLILPLAGHELGHSVWGQVNPAWGDLNIEEQVRPTVAKAITDSPLVQQVPGGAMGDLVTPGSPVPIGSWQNAYRLAMRQAEESFCDFVGLRLFGASYPNAFAYMVSPGHSGTRSANYPKLSRRASDIKKAGAAYGIEIDSQYEAQFVDEENPKVSHQESRDVQLADQASAAITDDLISLADRVAKPCAYFRDEDAIKKQAQRLREFVPIELSGSLASILDAGWVVYKEFLGERPNDTNDGSSKEKIRALKETVLKSIEVLEIESIMAASGAK